MFKTILATAAAALIVGTVAAPAQAGRPVTNGTSWNGVEMNAMTWNGLRKNGKLLNGAAPAASSFVLEAIELPPQEH